MNKIYNTILEQLPIRQANIIKSYTDNHSPSFFPAELINDLRQNQSLEELGIALLPLATSFAITPASKFNVGAVAFDSQGNAYLGANFEFTNTHIGHVIHAEQSAIANAWSHNATDLALLVVNYSPCGHCRQFINEVNLTDDFRIQLPDNTAKPLAYYLPDSFGPSDLNVTERILGGQPNTDNTDTDKANIVEMAKIAYEKSHAPYSNSKSGIALQYDDGEIVIGCYAENAAFNPSLPPLQMALNNRRLQGKDWKNIQRAVMIENPTSLSQKDNTEILLKSISEVVLEYISEELAAWENMESIGLENDF